MHVLLIFPLAIYTRKNAWSVTAFNSTDIRSVQDNVMTPVTAMMVTVCIALIMPYHLYSSVLIYLIPTSSISAVGSSCLLQPVLTDCNSLFPIYLYHSVTSDWYSPDNPTDCSSLILWYRQFWTVCRRQQSDTAMISYLYLWRFCVCSGDSDNP